MNGTGESFLNSVSTTINLNHFKLDKLYYNYSSMKYNNFPSDTDIFPRVYISGTPLIPVKCFLLILSLKMIQRK